MEEGGGLVGGDVGAVLGSLICCRCSDECSNELYDVPVVSRQERDAWALVCSVVQSNWEQR